MKRIRRAVPSFGLACLLALAGACEDDEAGADGGTDAVRTDVVTSLTDAGQVGSDAPSVDAPSAEVASGDTGSALCVDGAVRMFASAGELTAAIAGRWRYCGGGAPSEFMGKSLEFTADGQWFELAPDASGALVRQLTFGKAGRFSITGGGDASGGFSILMTYNNGGSSYGANVALSADPRRLQLGPDYLMPI